MRPLSITLILLACLLIALGRHNIRRIRRQTPPQRAWSAWFLVTLGFLAMIAGVVLW